MAYGAGNKQNVIQAVDLCTLFGELVLISASSPARLSPGPEGKPLTTEITVTAEPQISAAVHLAVQKRMKVFMKHISYIHLHTSSTGKLYGCSPCQILDLDKVDRLKCFDHIYYICLDYIILADFTGHY